MKYRLLLLLLLPCIAALIYFTGQKYEPGLMDFKGSTESAQTGAQTFSGANHSVAAAVDEIEGFKQSGKVRTFSKENLYEHVDGHAEYFISAGFVKLAVNEYVGAGSKDSEPEVQAEVYDMGKSIQAFGVLVDESGENATPLQIGAMGFKTSNGINFFKGRYYVKILSYNSKVPLLAFAKSFEKKLRAEDESFSSTFSKFPIIGKSGPTRFFKEGYRGLDFLHNVIEREYTVDGKNIKVALITGTERERAKVVSAFLEYFNKSGFAFSKNERDGKEVYKVSDKYEGDWLLVAGHDALFGIYGTADEDILRYFTKRP